MWSPRLLAARLIAGVGLVGGWVALSGANCGESSGGDAWTIETDVGAFYRKTILVGGSARAAGFTQPAYLEFGPDGRLYVTTYSGSLWALSLDANHEVIAAEELRPLGNRLLTGLTFDPTAPPDAPVMYVAHNAPPLYNAEDYTGAVARIGGLGTGPVEDIIVGLPRSAENHMTFSLVFGPDNRLYLIQGGNTNNGAAAPGLFANRSESPLSAALLVADIRDPSFAGISSVEVFAPGLRNAYGLCLHSNGMLYALDQGADPGFGGPPDLDCSTLPDVPGRDDVLHAILPNSYYGHPNPARNQCAYFTDLPDGTPCRSPLMTFAPGAVVTGITEYRSGKSEVLLNSQLIVSGFVDQNLYRVALSEDGLSVVEAKVLAGGFHNPIDVAVSSDGTIYVLEAGGTLAFGGSGPARITILEPLRPAAAPAVLP